MITAVLKAPSFQLYSRHICIKQCDTHTLYSYWLISHVQTLFFTTFPLKFYGFYDILHTEKKIQFFKCRDHYSKVPVYSYCANNFYPGNKIYIRVSP